MERRSLCVRIGMSDDVINKACSLAMAAHTSPASSPVLLDETFSPPYSIFAFPGSWSVHHWFSQNSFGDSKIDPNLFPSLRSVGNDETALVNVSFLQQFEEVLRTSELSNKVSRAVDQNKKIVFTGHSSGGPLAILATVWLLEQHRKSDHQSQIPPICVTFGSPLVGDHVFSHALQRENWSHHFIHFVTRYDIVPRILLAPLSSIERELQGILHFFNPKSAYFRQELIGRSQEALNFFSVVMRNALSVASHAACLSMGCTNLLLDAVTSFIALSPYRPFGTYIFCTGNGKLVAVENTDAVLQLLFYCLQLGPEQELVKVSYRSLQDHLVYYSELQKSQLMREVVYLDKPEETPLSRDGANSDEMRLVYIALNDLGLSTKARICLRAAGELEKQKLKNQATIDANFSKIEEALQMLDGYKATCGVREVAYYDAFKSQREIEDFNANVKRVELAGLWDEIIEMLKRYELPDGFEGRIEWVELGTKYRRLVEPLDIANYYRHSKNDDTGPYMIKGRPRRYRYTQRWLEHVGRKEAGYYSESCFWADVEELCVDAGNNTPFEEVKERLLALERKIERWVGCGELGRDVFLEESTFVKWWNTLPIQHRAGSCIHRIMNGEGRNLPPLNYTQ